MCKGYSSDAAKSRKMAGLLAGGELSLLTTAERVSDLWK